MINNIQYSVELLPINIDDKAIRRTLEDNLTDFRLSYWTLPPNAPQEVIRMIGQTEHGHSFLQFSNQLALLMINFDELYWEDRDQCFAYAHEKITRLKTALEMIGARVRHLGVISQRVMPEIVQPLSMLRDQIVKIETDLLVSNIATKIAVICENQYFVNIEMSNLPFRDESGQREALSVIVDINDKYGVDSKGGQSSLDRLSKILDLQKHISDEMINNLLRTGRLALYDA